MSGYRLDENAEETGWTDAACENAEETGWADAACENAEETGWTDAAWMRMAKNRGWKHSIEMDYRSVDDVKMRFQCVIIL